MRYLTIVLVKERLANRVMEIFEAIGIPCNGMKDKTFRKLVFVNEDLGVRFFLAKTNDVPTYAERGAADIGIVGGDAILEEGYKFYEVVGLEAGKCRVCVCGPESARERLEYHELIRAAAKYPNIAKDYFYNQKYRAVEVIKLNGSIELAPVIGLLEVIVDIVETGPTLRENEPMVLEEVCGLPVRMIVNQVSMKMGSERITAIIKKFQPYLKKNAGKQDDKSKSGKRRNVRHENRGIK